MPDGQLRTLLRHIRKIVEPEGIGGLSDAQLLARFLDHRDEAAFEVLVWRHAPMVLSLCRRLLRHEQDAEDAFQATFLILVRKAGAISKREALGSWLYKVAYRIALEARSRSQIRRADSKHLADIPAAATTPDLLWRDLRPVLDEELARLPDKYRVPFVLCYLEGKTNEEAARQLGCPKGTVLSRLSRARERLRMRLGRRGLALSAGLLASVVSEQAYSATVPAALVNTTIKAALFSAAEKTAMGVISTQVTALTEGVLRAMFWSKMKIAAAVLLAVSAAGFGVSAFSNWALGENGSGVQETNQSSTTPGVREELVQDRPLEAGGGQRRAEDRFLEAKYRIQSQNNLKQIALAMHNYHDSYGYFPAPAFYDKKREPGRAGGGGGRLGGGGGGGGGLGGGGVSGGGGFSGGGMGGGPSGGVLGGGGLKGGDTGTEEGGAFAREGGKALLSWRVALLPYLEENKLYREFRLDEPWDSAHNKRLLARMPKVFAPPGVSTKEPYQTFYQVFVGKDAGFEKHQRLRIAHIPDGTSNTIMIAEAGSPVPWTKPEDLVYDPDQPLPELGGLFPGLFHVAFFDGSVHTLAKTCNKDILRLAITRNDGQPIDINKLHAAGSAKATALKQENERLLTELQKAREELAVARITLQEAKRADLFDPETARLMRSNSELEEELRKTRKEIEALRSELERLRKDSERRN